MAAKESLIYPPISNYESLLNLLCLGRNTMHNNGVYFPNKKGDNRHVTYKGITYDFIDGQSILCGNLSEMINDIVDSPDVSNHAQIIDPSI